MARYTIRIKEILENYLFHKNNPSAVNNLNTQILGEIEEWENNFNTNYENPFERDNTPSVDDVINRTWNELFNFEYIKFKGSKEGELEKKIIKHFYMREIGFETIERFKLALNEKLNRIMPYYNDLYDSISLQGDHPLENYDLIDHSNRDTKTDNKGSGTTTDNTNTNAKQIFEDTPSNELSPDTNYATNITKNEGSSNSNGTTTNTNNTNVNDVYDRHAHGIMGYSKQDLLAKYRDNLLNIEELIIMELRDLFMLLY